MPAQTILLGVIGRPHGVRGLLHVQSYTANAADLASYGPLSDKSGRAWTLAWKQPGVAQLTDAQGRPVATRDDAARLTNLELYIERDRLPAPADDDEFYLADLVGLAAATPEGEPLGQVRTVHDYGAGTSLELTGGLIVPFTKACVPEIDLPNHRLTIAPPDYVEGEKPFPPGRARGEALAANAGQITDQVSEPQP